MLEFLPFQLTSAEWLAARNAALLALEMGLGKTAISIKATDLIQAMRVLVICPAVATENWAKEIGMWAESRGQTFDVFAYSQIHKIPAEAQWDVAILDESHFLKTPDAQRTRAIYGRTGVLRRVKRAWCMSGTPTPSNVSELWTMLYSFGITPLKFDAFVHRYCTWRYISAGGARLHITGNRDENIPELRELMKPFMLRKKKDDEDVNMQLPKLSFDELPVQASEVDITVESSFVQYTFPEDRKAELFKQLESERRLIKKMLETTGMGQDGLASLSAIAGSLSTLRRFTGLQKAPAVGDIVADELESFAYEKIVLFAIHRDVIEKLRVRLESFGVVTLYGGTDPSKRQRNVDKFQTNPKCRVMIANITSAGTAITLTAAHNIVFVEQDWVPGNNAQAAMRCHRIGQTKPVYCRFASLAGSLDQRISKVLKKKTADIIKLLD